jgi:hypothetical protein
MLKPKPIVVLRPSRSGVSVAESLTIGCARAIEGTQAHTTLRIRITRSWRTLVPAGSSG